VSEASRRVSSRAPAVAVTDLGRELTASYKAHPQDPDALTALGLYHYYVAPEDPERHQAAELLAEAAHRRPTPNAYLRLGNAESDSNDQERAFEEGLHLAEATCRAQPSACATAAALYGALGDLYYRARRERRAEELWRLATKADSEFYPAELQLAELSAD